MRLTISKLKRGLKCNYETMEENANFFKGKMKFSQQVRYITIAIKKQEPSGQVYAHWD